MFVGTIMLTPLYQLKGVAMAQLIQSLFIFILALIFTVKINSNNRLRYWKWSSQAFKELFNYGYKFQLVSISQLLYEPATKLLLSKYGGLVLLGHYEMATKAVNQFRALLTNANQVVVPVVAEKAKLGGSSSLNEFYIRMNRILLLFNLPLSTILIVATPFISLLWIGSFNDDFIFSMFALTASSFVNIMCGPAYFSSMGEGKLNVLVIVHVGMAIINILLGMLLGQYAGGYGIILAWAIALSAGSAIVIVNYNKSLKIVLFDVFGKEEFKLFLISIIIIIFNVLSYQLISSERNILKVIIGFFSLLLYLPFIFKNKNVRQIISSIKKKQ